MPTIAIASYRQAQQAAVLGLKDLFESAGAVHRSTTEGARQTSVVIIDDFTARPSETFDAVILPPSLGDRPIGDDMAIIADWVRARHEAGALICSICAGAFPLAETGLLDGRPATTHWALAEEFGKTFPDVQLDEGKLIIDDGDLITAGGLMAWTDLSLRLIARFLGPAVMLETARMFLIDPGTREQSYYNLFSPNLTHGDASILKAQRWLQNNFRSSVSVPMMARNAGLEERTFLRRFRAATGHNPSDYLQRLRIAKARELLELTTQTIEAIAAEVGYLDPPSFGKLFQRIVGLSPREYRKRFTPA